jgi:hypothetical protein
LLRISSPIYLQSTRMSPPSIAHPTSTLVGDMNWVDRVDRVDPVEWVDVDRIKGEG